MTLSVVFFLTTSPNVIYFLKIDDWVEQSEDARSEARLRLGFAVTNLLYYTNNATNFSASRSPGKIFDEITYCVFGGTLNLNSSAHR